MGFNAHIGVRSRPTRNKVFTPTPGLRRIGQMIFQGAKFDSHSVPGVNTRYASGSLFDIVVPSAMHHKIAPSHVDYSKWILGVTPGSGLFGQQCLRILRRPKSVTGHKNKSTSSLT